MRTFLPYAVIALLVTPGLPLVRAVQSDALLRDIEETWHGKVVRDPMAPDRPVVEIQFHCTSRVPDAVIEELGAFPKLRTLGLIGGQKLTNKGLEHIGKLTSLERLEIRNEKLTDEGLKHLARLPKLKYLFLWDVRLNKENSAALEGLQSLEVLELRSVRGSSEALTSLKKLARLKQLKGFRCYGVFESPDEVRKKLPDVKVDLRK
jgi:hypothetical protein